jgi:hypothetical protein
MHNQNTTRQGVLQNVAEDRYRVRGAKIFRGGTVPDVGAFGAGLVDTMARQIVAILAPFSEADRLPVCFLIDEYFETPQPFCSSVGSRCQSPVCTK